MPEAAVDAIGGCVTGAAVEAIGGCVGGAAVVIPGNGVKHMNPNITATFVSEFVNFTEVVQYFMILCSYLITWFVTSSQLKLDLYRFCRILRLNNNLNFFNKCAFWELNGLSWGEFL